MEELYSQKFKNNKIRSTDQAKKILSNEIHRLFAEQKKEEHAKETLKKVGNGKYIDAGIIARLFDIYDLSLDLNKIAIEGNVNSFMYGYYSAANTQLNLIINGIVPGRVVSTLESRGIKDNCDLDPEHILYSVGSRDALDENIKLEELPVELKDNKFYLQGYKDALEKLQSKGKGSR